MARFLVGMVSFLLNWPYERLDNCWIQLTPECHLSHIYGCLVMLVMVVVHRCHDLSSTINCRPTFAAYRAGYGSREVRPQQGGFQDRISSNCPSPVSYVCNILSSTDFGQAKSKGQQSQSMLDYTY